MAKQMPYDLSDYNRSKNDILRITTYYGTMEHDREHKYKITRLIRRSEYININRYIVPNEKTILTPYRWYEFQRLWTIPSFMISDYVLRKRLTTWRHTNKAINISIFSIEFAIGWGILKNLKDIFEYLRAFY